MIYEVKKTILPEDGDGQGETITFEIDDLVFFKDQPAQIRRFLDGQPRVGENNVEFDNATVILLETGRVLSTLKD